MRNEKDGHIYTNMFNLTELMQEERATKKDIASGIGKWDRLFQAKT